MRQMAGGIGDRQLSQETFKKHQKAYSMVLCIYAYAPEFSISPPLIQQTARALCKAVSPPDAVNTHLNVVGHEARVNILEVLGYLTCSM